MPRDDREQNIRIKKSLREARTGFANRVIAHRLPPHSILNDLKGRLTVFVEIT